MNDFIRLRQNIRILASILLVFLFVSIRSAYSQVNVEPSEYKGKGADISILSWNSDGIAQERVLLYNMGKDMFLTAGGLWGTRASTFTIGLPLQLTRVERKSDDGTTSYTYRIQGPFSNSNGYGTGDYLGVVNINGDDNGVYFDRHKDYGADWTLEKDETASNGDDVVYRIKLETKNNTTGEAYSNSNGYTLYANEPMTISVFEGGNNNLVKAVTDTEAPSKEDKYAQWKIVPVSYMENEFNKTYDKQHPSDATFLLRAQNFNRMNIYNHEDGFTVNHDAGWHKSEGSTFSYTVNFAKDVSGYNGSDDAKYGMFYCGSIKNGKGQDKLYQTVTITQSGWYRIDCQGFFYNSQDNDNPIAQLYAKIGDVTSNNAKDNAYVDFLPKSYGEPHDDVKFLADLSFVNNNNVVDNKVEAGALFYNQKYPNHLLIYVNLGDNTPKTLELGIEVTKDMNVNDYIYFDDFQLRYLGESFALDEGHEDFHNGMSDNESEYINRVMIFKRTYASNTWNSICLPVDLTKEQLNTAFFPNPKLAKLIDSDSPGTIVFRMVPLSKLGNKDVALRKGECYLIRPGYTGRSGDIEIGNAARTKVSGPYYTIDRISLTKKDVETNLNIATPYTVGRFLDNKDLSGNERAQDYYTVVDNTDCKLRVYGTFQYLKGDESNTDTAPVPATAYTFVNGKLYHLTSAYKQKGFSCWIEDEHQINNPATERHALKFSTYIDGVSDNTTAIEGFAEDVRQVRPMVVYNISGQIVRRGNDSLDGLPDGVYIVNGKRIVVK